MSKGWVLALDATDSKLEENLSSIGFRIDKKYSDDISNLDLNIARAQGIIIRSRVTLDDEILKKAVNLKWIGRLGSGLENINIKYAKKQGIACFSASQGNANSLAEHTLGLLLNLAHRISSSNQEIQSGSWQRKENIGWEIKGSTVGIIGFGPMGSAFASKLRCMDVKILAHDKYIQGFAPEYVDEVDLKTLQANSDIISIHLPFTSENLNFIDSSFIEKCKKLKILLNTSRGKILNTKDVFHFIKKDKLLGLGLDVLDIEPKSLNLPEVLLNDYKDLIKHPRVLITPHIAGWSKQSFPKMGEILFKKIERLVHRKN